MEKIRNMGPYTSVGSDGSIVSIEEQQEFIEKHSLQLKGSGDE
ncbi:hypothetical protein [Staphylospora marina]|nr:hypothetical protein [Staphylospora marina]